MNRQNVEKMIAYFEALPPERFDMNDWWQECGTVGCMAGHTIHHLGTDEQRAILEIVSKGEGGNELRWKYSPGVVAADILGLDSITRQQLFLPCGSKDWLTKERPYNGTTPQDAAEELRARLAAATQGGCPVTPQRPG